MTPKLKQIFPPFSSPTSRKYPTVFRRRLLRPYVPPIRMHDRLHQLSELGRQKKISERVAARQIDFDASEAKAANIVSTAASRSGIKSGRLLSLYESGVRAQMAKRAAAAASAAAWAGPSATATSRRMIAGGSGWSARKKSEAAHSHTPAPAAESSAHHTPLATRKSHEHGGDFESPPTVLATDALTVDNGPKKTAPPTSRVRASSRFATSATTVSSANAHATVRRNTRTERFVVVPALLSFHRPPITRFVVLCPIVVVVTRRGAASRSSRSSSRQSCTRALRRTRPSARRRCKRSARPS